jgi:2-oxoglutarate ferredoxin oxidoreductase subunit alpha
MEIQDGEHTAATTARLGGNGAAAGAADSAEIRDGRAPARAARAATRDSVSVALVGSGGSGVMTAGELLLRAAARGGWYGLMTRSAGPQIRGGEVAAYLTLSRRPVASPGDRFDVLLALDWNNADRFSAEIPLDGESLMISGEAGAEVPPAMAASGAALSELDFKEALTGVAGGRPNMLALGLLGGLLGLPEAALAQALEERLGSKGEKVLAASAAAVARGREAAAALEGVPALAPPAAAKRPRWVITGNQAAGLGALRGGVRFAAAYPITPATEILEWLSPRLRQVGGILIQAEDELASINMVIGASYGGVPALTATSGPGLALMMESLGLAVAAEVPVVVIDVMRCGPSTGIPTKSEQGDLNIAVLGLPGDAPHVVVAPSSIADCLFTTQWSVRLAEALQVPAIVLSDQALGQAVAVVEAPDEAPFATRRVLVDEAPKGYHRYALTESGISPMSVPGTPGGQYTADGLEHDPRGRPSSRAEDHAAQLAKRRAKVTGMDYGDAWAQIDGDGEGDLAVVTWGSVSGAVVEAARRLDPGGERIRVVTLRLIAPAQPRRLSHALAAAKRVLVVEQSHDGQFYHYLRSYYGLGDEAEPYYRAGPLPIRPGEVADLLEGRLGS